MPLEALYSSSTISLHQEPSQKKTPTQTNDKKESTTGQSVLDSIKDNSETKTGTLSDVTGGTSSGTTYLLRDNQMLYHTIEANLPDPQGNNEYEGWLVKKGFVVKFFSTGVMNKESDGTYSLSYTSNELSEGYDFVVITEETAVDEKPEKTYY
ncbi:hypothetical protein ACFL2R_00645 [Patescibacteria group bacterium]